MSEETQATGTNVIEEPPTIPEVEPITPIFSPTKKRAVDTQAEEMAKNRALPKPPGKILTFDQLYKWSLLLTPDMWGHTTIYVYRYFPIINRFLSDPANKKYIEKIFGPFDYDYMVNNHGGGQYGFDVTDTDKEFKVCSARLEVPMTQYDPILNYEEVDTGIRANSSYVQYLIGKGILDAVTKKPIKHKTPTDVARDSATSQMDSFGNMLDKVLGFVGKLTNEQEARLKAALGGSEGSGLSKGITELFLEKMKQENPNNQTTMFMSLVTAMKDMIPKTDSSNELYKQMIVMQQGFFTQVLELTKANNKPTETSDPFAALDKVLEVKEKLDSLGENSGKVSWQDRLIDGAERVVLPIVGQLTQMWMLNKQQQAMNNPQQVNRQSNPNPQPGQPKSNVTSISSANPFNNPAMIANAPRDPESMNQQPQPTNMPINQPNLVISSEQEIFQVINQYGSYIVNAIVGGTKGWDAGFDVSRVAGIVIHTRLKQLGVDNIINVAKQVPEFWNAVSQVGEEYVKTWLEEFINFEEHVPKDED